MKPIILSFGRKYNFAMLFVQIRCKLSSILDFLRSTKCQPQIFSNNLLEMLEASFKAIFILNSVVDSIKVI